MKVPTCDIEVCKAFSETGAIDVSTESAVHMRCICAFYEIGEVSRLIADLAEVRDVGLEIVANQDDVAFRA